MNATTNISQHLLAKAINTSHDGIAIIDARQDGLPLIYVSQGFERLTGYTFAEVVGKNYRILLGGDTDQPEIAVTHEAIT